MKLPPPNAKYVWFNDHGSGRNQFAMFRRVLTIQGPVQAGAFSLFADSAYQLFVNNRLVQFGPLRFDYRAPVFDRIDLKQYLEDGDNVLAVLVKAFGCKTFKDNSERGGLVAWGALEDAAGSVIDLATRTGNGWKCRQCRAYLDTAPKISFALDAIDIFDQELDEAGWKEVHFDDERWPDVVELAEGLEWGPLQGRTLPFFELKPLPYVVRPEILPLAAAEDIRGFTVPGPGFHTRDQHFAGQDRMAVAVSTCIHSPCDQTVTCAGFWGNYFINGNRLTGVENYDRMRTEYQVEFKSGWNQFYASTRLFDDCLSFLWSSPRGAGLKLSPHKLADDAVAFLRTEILPPAKLMALEEEGLHTELHARAWEALGGWRPVTEDIRHLHPVRRCLWDEYEQPFEHFEGLGQGEYIFTQQDYPNGFSLLMDLGQTRLVIPEFVVEGANGAEVDLCYSEGLVQGGPHLWQKHYYMPGDRLVPSSPRAHFLSSQPRGMRYARLTVRHPRNDVRVSGMQFLSAQYPVKRIGHFQCSDETLTKVWEMCERTQQVNMEDAYVDCVGRERAMYVRDAIIQFHNAVVAYGDLKLMRRCLEMIGQSADETGRFRCVYPNRGDYTITDYAIEAVDGFWQYYRYSGDKTLLEQHWPAIRENMRWFEQLSDARTDGLLDADWPRHMNTRAYYGGFHGDNSVDAAFMDRTGPTAHLTFPYLVMLRSGSQIARVLGFDDEAEELEQRHAALLPEARSLLWNSEKGCFNDNLDGRTQSLQASVVAVNAGVPEAWQRESIRDRIARKFPGIFLNGVDPGGGVLFSPAYSFFVFRTVYDLGLIERAEDFIREGWGWMLRQGLPTTPEFFNLDDSLCHAWSACPLYFLGTRTLGVEFPRKPDNAVVNIRVQSQLDWARGAVAIPGTADSVEVSWRRAADGRLEVEWEAPDYVEVKVLPGGPPWTPDQEGAGYHSMEEETRSSQARTED